jgi:hypothetical protein
MFRLSAHVRFNSVPTSGNLVNLANPISCPKREEKWGRVFTLYICKSDLFLLNRLSAFANSNASSQREIKFIRAGFVKEKSWKEQRTIDEIVLVKPFGFWTNCACSFAEPAPLSSRSPMRATAQGTLGSPTERRPFAVSLILRAYKRKSHTNSPGLRETGSNR